MNEDEPYELIQCALVIPRRSVDRVRRALEEGDTERALDCLEDIEEGIEVAYGYAVRGLLLERVNFYVLAGDRHHQVDTHSEPGLRGPDRGSR